MRLSPMRKKGQVTLDQIVPIVLTLVVAGIVVGAGALVLGKFADKLTAGSVEDQATRNASDGIKELASFFPTIGIIIAAVIIIGLVVGAFAAAGGRR